jgi:uncharacterized protein YodC (DUF2158 family)
MLVAKELRMLSSKHFTVSAVAALALGLAFSEPGLSASSGPTLSAKWASARQLHQGDLVRLRSGGPLMTVDAVSGDQVECVWTGDNGQTDDATFPAKMLQKF